MDLNIVEIRRPVAEVVETLVKEKDEKFKSLTSRKLMAEGAFIFQEMLKLQTIESFIKGNSREEAENTLLMFFEEAVRELIRMTKVEKDGHKIRLKLFQLEILVKVIEISEMSREHEKWMFETGDRLFALLDKGDWVGRRTYLSLARALVGQIKEDGHERMREREIAEGGFMGRFWIRWSTTA